MRAHRILAASLLVLLAAAACGKIGAVGGTLTVSKISCGATSTCAIGAEGTRCWGSNSFGELGDGTFANSPTPTPVLGNPVMSDIATGNRYACGIVGGGVQCWGENGAGVLASTVPSTICQPAGSSGNVVTCSGSPIASSSLLDGATRVAAGEWTACAVVGGALKCWGQNYSGQLGNGSIDYAWHPVPAQVGAIASGATDVCVGSYHACAVVNGAAYCWGENTHGEVGDGSSLVPRYSPTQVSGLTSGVTSITCGRYHTCAIVDGAARCWGYNGSGQVGDGTYTARLVPTPVSGLSNGVTSLSSNAYSHYSCAVTDGHAKCWGDNSYGNLGNENGNVYSSNVPLDVSSAPPGMVGISAGQRHACVHGAGSVYCWGDNSTGALGATVKGGWTATKVPGLGSL